LAQGLKRDGVEVEVFDRDHAPTDRLQGYRLSISATGRRALESCLPGGLFEKLIANCAKPSESVAFLDHHLNRLLVIDLPHNGREAADSELPVSRIALRCILSEGLNESFIKARSVLHSRTNHKAPLPHASRTDRPRLATS
jgi:hypothetical protein